MSVESFTPTALQFTHGAAHKVKSLVDEEGNDRQYLAGAEVDYQEGLEGSRFVIKNPNATTTCGCGSSFSI